MGAIVSQITSLSIVYSTVYSGTDQRKHQSSASLAFVREIQRGPLNESFPAQRASNAENVSIRWRHHEVYYTMHPGGKVYNVMHPIYKLFCTRHPEYFTSGILAAKSITTTIITAKFITLGIEATKFITPGNQDYEIYHARHPRRCHILKTELGLLRSQVGFKKAGAISKRIFDFHIAGAGRNTILTSAGHQSGKNNYVSSFADPDFSVSIFIRTSGENPLPSSGICNVNKKRIEFSNWLYFLS